MTKITEIPNSKNICDACKYDYGSTSKAAYKIKFCSGDDLNICFACFDELYIKLQEVTSKK